MTALVACETVLLVLLVVLVAGLLRSHAEILRRLGPPQAGPVLARGGRPASARVADAPAPEIAGATLDGGMAKLSPAGAGPTLLAFLSSGCTTCRRFWDGLAERRLPGGLGLLVVTHDATRESPARLRTLAPAGATVIMSSAAYASYQIPGVPYFVLVDGSVRGEGMAGTWDALQSLLSDALADARENANGGDRPGGIDARLAAGGIAPGDPSLYPASRATASQ